MQGPMIIACISDIHDRLDNLELTLKAVKRHRPEILICCGDLSKPPTLVAMASGSGAKEIHVVAGNVDSEHEIKGTIDKERLLDVYYHQLTGRLTADKRHVAFTHKPKDAEVLLQEDFDVVFHGHTHEARVQKRNDTLLVCPGDIEGRYGQPPSYATYNTTSGTAALHTVS